MNVLPALLDLEDKKFKVSMPPSDEVTPEGQMAVRRTLHINAVVHLPEDWDWKWLVTKGQYAGTLPKRIASYSWKTYKKKLNTKILGEIGDLAKKHIQGSQIELYFDATKNLGWDDGDFGDEGSCYWNDYTHARDVISQHGLAIRTWSNEWANGLGRCFMLPWSGHPVLFNSYGPLSLVSTARILATFFGASYKRLTNVYGRSLYINGGSGYMLGPSSILGELDENHQINWSLEAEYIYDRDSQECENCGRVMHGDDQVFVDRLGVCCCECATYCEKCSEGTLRENLATVHNAYYSYSQEWCTYCRDNAAGVCDWCNEYYHQDYMVEVESTYYCTDCADERATQCKECSEYFLNHNIEQHNNAYHREEEDNEA